MHLVDDVHFVFAGLRGKAHLVYQGSYVFYRVVGGSVEFVYVEREILVLRIGHRAAVYLARQYSRAGGFAYSARPAKQHGLCQLVVLYGVFKRAGHVLLSYHLVESAGAVFTCRYYEMLHLRCLCSAFLF